MSWKISTSYTEFYAEIDFQYSPIKFILPIFNLRNEKEHTEIFRAEIKG